MPPIVRDIPCPHCNGVLYRIAPVDPHVEYWSVIEGHPPLEHDGRGRFLTCQHCARRVDLAYAPWLVNGEFRVADVQGGNS